MLSWKLLRDLKKITTMAKTVDPAFQAAPYLGDSSHDPIEFVRRQNAIKYQRSKEKQNEIEKNTAKGLDKLMIDLDGWNDKEGFREVISRQQKAKDMYMDLATKGVNFINPTTEGEVMAYKALTDYQAKTKEMADLRNAQKLKVEVINKLRMTEQAKGKEDDQSVDWDATEANLTKALSNNTISGRDEILNNALVVKPTIGDVNKFINEIKARAPKLDVVSTPYTDENGQQGTRLVQIQDAKKQKEIEDFYKNQYKYAPEGIKNAVKQQGERNKGNEVVGFTDEDRFVSMADQNYQQKFLDKKAGTGEGFNINLFGGQKAKVTPAIKNNNSVPLGDRTYNEHYDFNIKTPFIGISMSALGADVYQGDKWEPASKEGGLVNAQLNFYDPKTDSFIFTSTANSMDAGVFKSQTFSVPRSRLGKEVDDLPIVKDDGKPGKLKDIYGKVPEGKRQLVPNSFWSALYIPTKNKK